MSRPRRARQISLYIPARNAARTLPETLRAVMRQTLRPAEVLLVVDARSADQTLTVARRSGLRVIVQHDGPLGAARNLALRAARTPLLACCDADVCPEPQWLEHLWRACTPDVAAVGGATHERTVGLADRWRALHLPHNWGPLPLDNPFMLVSEMLARVDRLRAVGGYRDDLAYNEDSDLCRRLRDAGCRLRYEPRAVAWHLRRDTVRSVLELRWNYAFNRQRGHLESLEGLRRKLAVNRAYTLLTLGRSLHGPWPETAAVSLLLWYHHALRDLHAVLSRWPLVEPAERAACMAALWRALRSGTPPQWRGLTGAARWWLADLLPAARKADGLARLPGFRAYLAHVRQATAALLASLPDGLCAALRDVLRALACGGDVPPGAVARPALSVSRAERCALRRVEVPAWCSAELAGRLASLLPGPTGPPRWIGPHLPQENLPPSRRGGLRLVLVPHLEAFARPQVAFCAAARRADVLVVACRLPREFVPGVPPVTARDLAVWAAQAGLRIADFATCADQTRLVLFGPAVRRARPARRAASPAAAGSV